MESLKLYFEDAQAALGMSTKAELARHLGLLPQELNRAQKEGYCSDQVIERLAEITKTPAVMVYTARELTKPQTEAMRSVWTQIYINLQDLKNKKKLYFGPIKSSTEKSAKSLSNQGLTGFKDYRKYVYHQLHQFVSALFSKLTPRPEITGRTM